MRYLYLFCVSAMLFLQIPTAQAGTRLINGKPVEPGTYKEVISIKSGNAGCTATIIGPRVIATAAHCAHTGATATFTVEGVQYEATITRSSLYPGKDHDIALGVTSKEIQGVEPASIGAVAEEGLGITLLGFGCTEVGGTGGNDGILRVGNSAIVGFSAFDMVSRMPGGAALCYGDSGGPAFVIENDKHLLLGVNSKGNIQDTNYNTRTDIPESQSFLKSFAETENVDICGFNKDCGEDPPPPPPTCILKASPNTVQLGQSVTLSLASTGEVTEASINGVPVTNPTGQSVLKPPSPGTFKAQGKVKGPGGEGTCEASYVVEDSPVPPAPTCTLAAIPDAVKLGEMLTLEITTQGQVTAAYIDNTSVSYPVGKKNITPTAEGVFTSQGKVEGPGGMGTCTTSYEVNDDGPNPNIPNFSAVPAYCGQNNLGVTQVRTVCLAVLKKDSSLAGLKLNKVILVQYANGSKEVLPIIVKKQIASNIDELVLYANSSVPTQDYMVLDTRKAELTKTTSSNGEVPVAIKGRTATGVYFIVDSLQPMSISF